MGFREEIREEVAERGAGSVWEGKKAWRVGREGKVWMEMASSAALLLAVLGAEEEKALLLLLMVSEDDMVRWMGSPAVRIGEGFSAVEEVEQGRQDKESSGMAGVRVDEVREGEGFYL